MKIILFKYLWLPFIALITIGNVFAKKTTTRSNRSWIP